MLRRGREEAQSTAAFALSCKVREWNREHFLTTVGSRTPECHSRGVSVASMSTLSQGVRLAKSEDGGVLLDLDRGAFFNLNSVGARIIELLDKGCVPSLLAHVIANEFHVSEEIAKRDIDEFLESLRQHRLVLGEERRGRPGAHDK